MFSPLKQNALFCCLQYRVMYDDITKLASLDIYKYCHSLLRSLDLLDVARVLLELVNVRDGAFYLPDFDAVVIRTFIECLCKF